MSSLCYGKYTIVIIFKRSLMTIAFALSIFSLSAHAYFSTAVSQAMSQVKHCYRSQFEAQYSDCVLAINDQLKAVIFSTSVKKSQSLSPKKQKLIQKKIRQKIKSNANQCFISQSNQEQFSGNNRSQMRCLYENMLELLINVERNIQIFTY